MQSKYNGYSFPLSDAVTREKAKREVEMTRTFLLIVVPPHLTVVLLWRARRPQWCFPVRPG